MGELLSFALIGLWIFGIVDSVVSDPTRVRNLPKWAWIVLIVLLGPLGTAAWLFLGRPTVDGGTGAARDARPPRQAAQRRIRPRPAAAERADDEASIRANIEARDRMLADWAAEEERRKREDGPDRS